MLRAFLLSGLLSVAAFGGAKAQNKAPLTVLPTRTDTLLQVADDQIDLYADSSVARIVAFYRENARLGSSSVVLMGQTHDSRPHHMYQMLVNKKLLTALGPENVILAFEERPEDETMLKPFQENLVREPSVTLGKSVGYYAGYQQGWGQALRTMNIAQSLRSGTSVHFIDAPQDKKDPFIIDSVFAAALVESAFYKNLAVTDSMTQWRTVRDRRSMTSPEGRTLRDAAMAKNIVELLPPCDPPKLVVHEAGQRHLYDADYPERTTLLAMLHRQKSLGVMSFSLVCAAYVAEYRDGLAHTKIIPPHSFTAVFSDNFSKENTLRDSEWDKLCDKNKVPEYKFGR